jgi:signal transduction histidine kinase
MGKLRVLVAEDSVNDYELLLRELRKSGYETTTVRVDTPEAMAAALDREPWDVVVTDWTMPSFSALAVIEMLKTKALDLPLIIASGTVDDETAVEAMRAGAHDFMSKSKLARLGPAIERELREARMRRERSAMQEQLLISDRMASVGLLAAGVAHEINNPLSAVMANVEIAARQLQAFTPPSTEVPPALVEIGEELADALDAAVRIRDIVRDVMLFSRSEDDKRELIDVGAVLKSSLRMAWNEIKHRAEVVEDYGDVHPVRANESRLGQVFLNLIVNAAQAIPVGNAAVNQIRIATRTDPEDRVVVEISDTGVGMSADVLRRLFTPFFTTKDVGVGTGLGLSICHRIITELGGDITADSTPGAGSTFRVRLPPAISLGDARPPSTTDRAPALHAARVLVVDDDAMVARAVALSLAASHEVVTTLSAAAARARIATGERFDVIVCDLMMPEMTGMELYAAIGAIAPDQADRMIFMTGGTFTEEAQDFLEQVDNLRLEKPFRLDELVELANRRIAQPPRTH